MRRAGLILTLIGSTLAVAHADNWPQWRGAAGTGVTTETALPERWGNAQSLAWRVRLGGLGVSTPVVWGDLVIATSQVGAGSRRAGSHPSLVQGADAAASGERTLAGRTPGAAGQATTPAAVTFVVSALKWSDGSVQWTHETKAEGPLPAVHDKHNLATASPVTDGQVVVGWFGTGQVVALDLAGKPLWSRHLGREYSPFEINWGHASSPILHGDLAIFLCYHESASYLLALDKRTGAVRWKRDRDSGVL